MLRGGRSAASSYGLLAAALRVDAAPLALGRAAVDGRAGSFGLHLLRCIRDRDTLQPGRVTVLGFEAMPANYVWRTAIKRLRRRSPTRRIRAIAVRSLKWESPGIVLPIETSIDSVGRIVVPKPLRDALGLTPGSTVDISRYGAGLQLLPAGRTARLVDESGVLVATGETAIDDEVVFGLIDSARR
jgi:AbrB family looped-hinge helix DNA binding protein